MQVFIILGTAIGSNLACSSSQTLHAIELVDNAAMANTKADRKAGIVPQGPSGEAEAGAKEACSILV
jgi:hypothetical protein